MAIQKLTVSTKNKRQHVYTATPPRHGGGLLRTWHFNGMIHQQFPPIRVAYLRELLVAFDDEQAPFTALIEQADGREYLLAFRKVL